MPVGHVDVEQEPAEFDGAAKITGVVQVVVAVGVLQMLRQGFEAFDELIRNLPVPECFSEDRFFPGRDRDVAFLSVFGEWPEEERNSVVVILKLVGQFLVDVAVRFVQYGVDELGRCYTESTVGDEPVAHRGHCRVSWTTCVEGVVVVQDLAHPVPKIVHLFVTEIAGGLEQTVIFLVQVAGGSFPGFLDEFEQILRLVSGSQDVTEDDLGEMHRF